MNQLKLIGITLLSLIALIGVGIFGLNSIQNKAIILDEQVQVAASDIQIQEKRRVDLVYNLADTVKNYDKHEAETLKGIAEARGQGNNEIDNVTTMISAVSEAYPELKSNENYKELMNELSVTENLIAQYRTNYNQQVKEYNRYVKKFPNKQFLDFLGYEVSTHEYLNYNAPSDAPQNLFD